MNEMSEKCSAPTSAPLRIAVFSINPFVFFSDAKRILGLADCSARDFSSQIAHVSLVIVRYNLPASLKRPHDYETM